MKPDEEILIKKLTKGFLVSCTSIFPGKGASKYEYAMSKDELFEWLKERID